MTDLFDEFLAGPRADPALVYEHETLTFGTLRALLREITRTLFGTAEKKLAFCFLPNCLELVITYLSAVTSGQVAGLFPAATPPHRQRGLIETYRPEVVVVANEDLAEFLRSLGYSPLPRLTPANESHVWAAKAGGHLPVDLALLLSTSGSTGTPKLVRLSASNLIANARGIGVSLGITPAQRAVTSVPLCYSYGLSILNSHLAAHSCVVITDRSPLTHLFWRLVNEQGVVEVAGTPIAHRAILGTRGRELPSSVRVMTQAGGRLPTELTRSALAWMDRTGGRFFCMYGQTEATARISCLDASMLASKLGSAGTALEGGRISVGPPLAGGDGGPIIYRGPNVMMGYATCRGDLARGQDVDMLETGDLGHLDADGYLYVTGRSSRFAKLMDRRVSLDDVEEWFHPRYRCAAVAVPTASSSIVVFTTSQQQNMHKARMALAAELEIPSSSILIHPIAAIPLTLNGKVNYADLERAATHLTVTDHPQSENFG